MCRFIAYAGSEPVTIASLVTEPEHGLLGQCRSPRFQTRTKDNPDGYGVAWYEADVVRRHRAPIPMWEDIDFLKRARALSTNAFIAAIRKATPGIVLGEENTPPYINGGWVFAHNGSVDGWVEGNDARARAMVSPRRLVEIEGTTDSEVMFAMVLDRLDDGASPFDAVVDVTSTMAEAFGGYLNLILTDGERIAASAWGNSLFARSGPNHVEIASEPYDDDDEWEQVPDRAAVDGVPGSASITTLQVSGAR